MSAIIFWITIMKYIRKKIKIKEFNYKIKEITNKCKHCCYFKEITLKSITYSFCSKPLEIKKTED